MKENNENPPNLASASIYVHCRPIYTNVHLIQIVYVRLTFTDLYCKISSVLLWNICVVIWLYKQILTFMVQMKSSGALLKKKMVFYWGH